MKNKNNDDDTIMLQIILIIAGLFGILAGTVSAIKYLFKILS